MRVDNGGVQHVAFFRNLNQGGCELVDHGPGWAVVRNDGTGRATALR